MKSSTKTNHDAPPSPGSLLSKGRIENNWSVSAVAQILCLSSEQLKSLEGDNYENLPGRTYILGYLRNYAKLLGINIEDSIATHKNHLINSNQTPRSHLRLAGTELSDRRFGILFTLLSMVFLLGVWYWQMPAPDSLLNKNWQTVEVSKQNAAAAHADPDDASWSGVAESPIALPELDSSEKNNRLLSSETLIQPQAVERVASDNEIAFAVDQKSWLEVRDADGNQLIHRTVARGQNLTLEGKPPFTVFIGTADGVAVQYRGEPVSFAADRGGLFARFTVGEPQFFTQ